MKEIERCPYCGSEDFIQEDSEFARSNGTPYHCNECDCWFDEEEIMREDIRHKISAILMDTNEDNQMKCYIAIEPEDTRGLGSAYWPTVDSCFQVPGEGTIWFHFEGEDDFTTGEKNYKNFDDIDTKDLQVIYNELSEQCDCKVVQL